MSKQILNQHGSAPPPPPAKAGNPRCQGREFSFPALAAPTAQAAGPFEPATDSDRPYSSSPGNATDSEQPGTGGTRCVLGPGRAGRSAPQPERWAAADFMMFSVTHWQSVQQKGTWWSKPRTAWAASPGAAGRRRPGWRLGITAETRIYGGRARRRGAAAAVGGCDRPAPY